LTLLNTHYTYHTLGIPIVKTLLSPQWIRRLNSYIGGSHTELILVTLKLFNGMSAFGGGRERKSVMDGFAWETKVRPHA
jgi:nucleolar pre-ribosomal-associated protein 1